MSTHGSTHPEVLVLKSDHSKANTQANKKGSNDTGDERNYSSTQWQVLLLWVARYSSDDSLSTNENVFNVNRAKKVCKEWWVSPWRRPRGGLRGASSGPCRGREPRVGCVGPVCGVFPRALEDGPMNRGGGTAPTLDQPLGFRHTEANGHPAGRPFVLRICGPIRGPPEVHLRSSRGPPQVHPRSTQGPPMVHPRSTRGPPEVHPRSNRGPTEVHPRSTRGPPRGECGASCFYRWWVPTGKTKTTFKLNKI